MIARTPVLIALTRFSCASCAYGASSRIAPERCPMCGGTAWHLERQPTTSAAKSQAHILWGASKRSSRSRTIGLDGRRQPTTSLGDAEDEARRGKTASTHRHVEPRCEDPQVVEDREEGL